MLFTSLFAVLSVSCYLRPTIAPLFQSLCEVCSFKNDIIKTWQRGFHFSRTFSLCCLFPSLSLWVFSTGLISCSLWLPWKRWQTGQQPLKQQHVFLLSHQDATGMQATRLSQHWAQLCSQEWPDCFSACKCVSGTVWVGVCAVHVCAGGKGVIQLPESNVFEQQGLWEWNKTMKDILGVNLHTDGELLAHSFTFIGVVLPASPLVKSKTDIQVWVTEWTESIYLHSLTSLYNPRRNITG